MMIFLAAMVASTDAAPSLANAPGALTPAPLMVDCLFPDGPPGTKAKMDDFAVLIDGGLKVGPLEKATIADGSNIMPGAVFDAVKPDENAGYALLGFAMKPHPILSLTPAKDGPGYDAAMGFAGSGKPPRLGRCFFLAGPEAAAEFASRSKSTSDLGGRK